MATPVLLFDGVCNLCNGAVNFILDHERGPELHFGALQSRQGRALIERFGGSQNLDTLVVIDAERRYERSAAVLQVARYLRWPWRAVRVFAIVPRPLLDVLYKLIARNRYRWFGKKDSCRIPSAELRARFFPEDEPHSPGAVASIASA